MSLRWITDCHSEQEHEDTLIFLIIPSASPTFTNNISAVDAINHAQITSSEERLLGDRFLLIELPARYKIFENNLSIHLAVSFMMTAAII